MAGLIRAIQGSKPIQLISNNATMLVLLAIRVCGGLAGAGPALLAIFLLNREDYGTAAANIATALLIIGPIVQFLGQGYLRSLMHNHLKHDEHAPAGSLMILLYLLTTLSVLLILGCTGLWEWTRSLLVASMSFMLVALKILEVNFISQKRRQATVVFFYILPPVLHCILMSVFFTLHWCDSYWATSAGYLCSLMLSACIALGMDVRAIALFYRLAIPRTRGELKQEFTSASLFFGNGAILSAADQLPTILLRHFGLAYHVPAFELVRKIISVPSLIVHAFGMHFSPEMIAHAHKREFPEFRKTFKAYFIATSCFGGIYIACVLLFIALSAYLPGPFKNVDMQSYWPLFISALVTTMFSPVGSALIALKGDKWWGIGAVCGLSMFLTISLLGHNHWQQLAVALAILGHNLTLSLCVGFGVIRRLREVG